MEATKDKKISSYVASDLAMPNFEVLTSQVEGTITEPTYDKKIIAYIRAGLIIFFIIGSAVLITFMAVGYTEMVGINSNTKITKDENKELTIQVESLEKKIKPYISKTRIENIARNRLGMIFPGKDNIVSLDDNFQYSDMGDKNAEVTSSANN